MALRVVAQKGIHASHSKALTSIYRDAVASITKSGLEARVKAVRCIPEFPINPALQGADNGKFLTNLLSKRQVGIFSVCDVNYVFFVANNRKLQ
ncbi:unnamed protein product [Ilex paraguariensis]|uniref:Uncharacterized protein n=1 Tax=Ilex paraguariensis TaxID=185542 RepID=A0ABC8T0S0_9AQUA